MLSQFTSGAVADTNAAIGWGHATLDSESTPQMASSHSTHYFASHEKAIVMTWPWQSKDFDAMVEAEEVEHVQEAELRFNKMRMESDIGGSF